MAEWWWVAIGYGMAYGALAGYLFALRRRAVRARQSEEGSG